MKYDAKHNLLEELKPLPYFTKDSIFQIGQNKKAYTITPNTVHTYIHRFLKEQNIIPLMRGVYVTKDYYTKNKRSASYLFFLANVLRQPSYISSWTALQYYHLTTDVIHVVTSVTPKVTRTYKTKLGTFAYHNLQEKLFSDFVMVDSDYSFYIATPAKALFDLLYLRTRQFRGLTARDIHPLLDELRIDINEMEKSEQKKFRNLLKHFLPS